MPLLNVLALTVGLLHGQCGHEAAGYLQASCSPWHVESYTPQAGDLIFFDDHKLIWRFLDCLACTGPPDHNGIVFKMPDGSLAVLESAPDGVRHVMAQDVLPRLAAYKGTVWVRRLKCPLSEEQSAKLTGFALEQIGKRYAVVRLALQITPLRARGPVSTRVLGHTFMHRRRWYCSELVVAAGVAAGLFDPKQIPANTVYPRDIFDDHRHDLSCLWHDAAYWSVCPPLCGLSADADAP